MSGRIEALWSKRAHRGPMDAAERLALVAGRGIRDDANFGRSRRQVTVIEKEVLDAVIAELPEVEPSMRRANVMVSGVRLEESRGKVLSLGAVRIHLFGETRPCERMDEQVPGLTAALDPEWRGGAYGVVLDEGEIAVGDPVTLATATAAEAEEAERRVTEARAAKAGRPEAPVESR